MQTIYQTCSWPGVLAVESCAGTISHGISPAAFVLVTYPQAAAPRETGDLVIGDGLRRVVLRDCKVDAMAGRAGGDGQTWTVTILDRRWRWRGGKVSGRYNQLDPRGKLVPWSIRTPTELAELCLKAMGETNYVVRLPPGLSRPASQAYDRYLRLGENFPQSLTNPPVVWDYTPPAEALARLAEQYGCRVIYQPNRDRVIVVPLGEPEPDAAAGFAPQILAGADAAGNNNFSVADGPVGIDPSSGRTVYGGTDAAGQRYAYTLDPEFERRAGLSALGGRQFGPLPDGPCEMVAPNINSPETPAAVAVASAPVRFQLKMLLEAVGEEWDGSYLPIEQLSYAPDGVGKPQISKVTWTGGVPTSVKVTLTYYVNWNPQADPQTSVEFAIHGGGVSFAADAATVAAMINASDTGKLVVASVGGGELVLKGRPDGFTFGVAVETSNAPPDMISASLTQAAQFGRRGDWDGCPPPNYGTVRATDRLSYLEAQSLARKSVFKCYRILNVDPDTGREPMTVPLFGKITRRQQIILTNSKVEQVKPAARLAGGANAAAAALPAVAPEEHGILPDFYNGFSRDQQATVTGSVSQRIGTVMWNPTPNTFNTPKDSRVYVGFETVPREQMIVFYEPVYEHTPIAGANCIVHKPTLKLETGVILTDAETGEVVRWFWLLPLHPGDAAPGVQPQILAGVDAAGNNHFSLADGPAGVDPTTGQTVYAGTDAAGQRYAYTLDPEFERQAGLSGAFQAAQGRTARPRPVEWSVREDLAPGIIVRYYQDGKTHGGWEVEGADDTAPRAAYYLRGMAARYQLTGGESRQYIGIYPIDPDGLVQQVTFSIGGGGATTVASTNGEHSDVIPGYPARRRAENLPPDRAAALANKLEQDKIDRALRGGAR